MHKKVRFKGEIYWYHTSEIGLGVNISPLDHYTDSGELLADPLYDISYAVINEGSEDIMRYGEKIGTVSDLEDVNE